MSSLPSQDLAPDEKARRIASLLTEQGPALALYAAQWADNPDDCVQEGLIRLAGQATWPDNAVAWLYRVVKNLALGQLRSGTRRRRHETIAARLRPEGGAKADSGVDTTALAVAIESLNANEREVVIAKVWGKLTLEQIAQLMGTSKSTVHRQYEAALAALRERLGVSC
jgi:RNA polymerase sigma factor (sigma-70 family)